MPQNQHIQLRLMVPHENRRPRFIQPIALVLNLEPHARESQHGPFERLRSRPLSETAVASDVEGGGGESAVQGAEEEGEEGGEGAAAVFEGWEGEEDARRW